jgi:hypothetical protein
MKNVPQSGCLLVLSSGPRGARISQGSSHGFKMPLPRELLLTLLPALSISVEQVTTCCPEVVLSMGLSQKPASDASKYRLRLHTARLSTGAPGGLSKSPLERKARQVHPNCPPAAAHAEANPKGYFRRLCRALQDLTLPLPEAPAAQQLQREMRPQLRKKIKNFL